MPVTIHVNGTSNSLIHKGSMSVAKSTLPDVCKTPSPGGPIPVPYPVIVSMSSQLVKGTTTVKVDGGNMAAVKGSELSMCNGDEAGTAGGVKSSTFMKEAAWLLYSFDVKLDGKNACRLSDKMQMNHGNSACLGGITSKPVKPSGMRPEDDKLWDECIKQHDKYDAIKDDIADLKTGRHKELRGKVSGGMATAAEKIEITSTLIQIMDKTDELIKEREIYIDMGCDKFDYYKKGLTEQDRRVAHKGEVKNNKSSKAKLFALIRGAR